MIHLYTLDDGSQMLLCGEHRKLVKDQIANDDGREQGGKWRCRVCSIHRRLTGGLLEPVSAIVGSYIVTRYPTGVIYCTCPSWRFKRVPVAERTCKHIPEAIFA